MPRVKIKCRGAPSKEKKLKLLEILFSKEIHITKVFPANDGFALLLLNEEHVDKVFYRDIKEALEKENFTPILPPEQKVKRSVIVTRVDGVIYDEHEPNDIALEMEARNPWMEGEIEQLFMFPNSPTLKITFTQSATAKKCVERGFLAYNISVPPNDIKQETYIPVKCCMHCFQLEGHSTRECQMSKDTKLCSECSKAGHLWYQCKEEEKKCVNCSGSHSTMAMRCPKRKEIIKKKREEEQGKNRLSYKEAAKINLQRGTQPTTGLWNVPAVTKEEMLKIHICVAHARMKDTDLPGSYETELNKILKLNNLPAIKVPKDTGTDITATQAIPPTTNPQTGATAIQAIQTPSTSQAQQQPPKVKPRIERSTNIERRVSRDNIEEELQEREDILPLQASDLGLIFYTTNEKGWPKETFTREDLLREFIGGQFKWTCKTSTYSEREIFQLIRDKKIILDKCWCMVDSDVYRKIRSGITEERSPIGSRDPRIRKLSQ